MVALLFVSQISLSAFVEETSAINESDISHMTFARPHRRALRVPVYPPSGRIQAFMSRTPLGVFELGARSALREPQNPLQARFARAAVFET